MNTEQNRWARLYQAALAGHLRQENLRQALALGRQAAVLGMETLDVARVHEQILAKLIFPASPIRARKSTVTRAERFFSEAIVPIEQTHSAAVQTDVRVQKLFQTLRRRTEESSTSTRHLARGIVRRQAAESALKVSGKQRLKLVREARHLQQKLRGQTRMILAAQEAERKKSSRELHNEIAQMLLAIDVRLLSLKQAAQANTQTLQKEIAATQLLVKLSVRTIHRLAHAYGAKNAT